MDVKKSGLRTRSKKGHTDWIPAFLAALMLLAPFLGGSTRRWSEGLVMAFLGILIALRPPPSFGSRRLAALFLGLLALAATAFLPADWFFSPHWRQVLSGPLGLQLSSTVSPQPWLSLDCLLLLFAGLLWIYWLQAQSWQVNAHRGMLNLFTAGAALFAALALAAYSAHFVIPFWLTRERMFGPFPNRNQTANFFALTAILTAALAYEAALSKKIAAAGWALALGIIGTALVVNYSRGGIIVFFAGLALWLVLMVALSPSLKWIASAASLLLLIAAVFLFFGGATLDRFRGGGGLLGFRSLVFKDAVTLIHSSPWCGIGLGNFDAVFALFRSASASQSRIIHPESDWLWLWSEMGWLAVVLVLAAIAVLAKQVFPLRRGTNRQLRAAALAAASAATLHGVVDVSGHRLGSMLPALFILGLALPPHKEWLPDRWAPVVFRFLAMILVAAGLSWFLAAVLDWPLPGEIAADIAKAKTRKLMEKRDFVSAIPAATAAFEWKPLDWELYYARGTALTVTGKWVLAIRDFRRANTLETSSETMPFEEGKVWISRNPEFAVATWQEALKRSRPDEAVGLYTQMLRSAAPKSLLRQRLRPLSEGNARLEAAYLLGAPEEEMNQVLNDILRIDPSLGSLPADEQSRLFSLWATKGDAALFMEQLALHPAWQENGWQAAAQFYASQNDFAAACKIARRYLRPPVLPKLVTEGSEQSFQHRLLLNPADFSAGYALYSIQLNSGREDDALATVEQLEAIRGCPPYFHFLAADYWAKHGESQKTWRALAAYGKQEPVLTTPPGGNVP